MPQLAEQATDPGRMRPDFQCDPTARHRPENFLQCFRIRTDSLLQLYLAGLIHHAVPTVAIAQIQSNGQFPLRNIPALRCCSGANLLHCRSPFYLCLEHVDNLGAYTASRPETGLLIPSDFSSCVEQCAVLIRLVKSNRMGKGRKKRRSNKQSQRTREELDLIKERILERFEGGRAERERAEHERAEHADAVSFLARAWRDAPARAGGDSPPILGETDPLVRSPLKPKPYLR